MVLRRPCPYGRTGAIPVESTILAPVAQQQRRSFQTGEVVGASPTWGTNMAKRADQVARSLLDSPGGIKKMARIMFYPYQQNPVAACIELARFVPDEAERKLVLDQLELDMQQGGV